MYQFETIATQLPEPMPRPQGAETPLSDLRVIDFTHYVAGPYATMLLADMGADVLKIEAPGRGDDFRHYPPADPQLPLQGAPYLWTNRNKRSIALNMKSPEGRQIALDLIATADVLVENFSTGVMQRFGLDYAQCKAVNPRLIYCSVSAYGRTGKYADRLGFDPVVQAESGFMSMNGYPDRDGTRTASTVMDIATAMMASNAILAALMARQRTGKGQFIEATLYDTALTMTGFATMQHLCTGFNPKRTANYSPDTSPSGLFQCQDRSFYINCGNTGIFQRLFDTVLGMPEIANDPELSTGVGRVRNRDRLFAILAERLAEHPWAYWQPRLRDAGVPTGEFRTLAEALASDETRERGLVTRIAHPDVGWIPNLGLPIRFSDTPVADPHPAPTLGQHTGEVLAEVLGYSADQIDTACAAGVIGVSAPRAGKLA
jgi:crotonobetainyl-CoA:carnitine CoA-transferase CaiB-like acyl-CoA transferase